MPVQVDAVAARWTPDAFGIVFHVGGKEQRYWVWTGAIEEAAIPRRSALSPSVLRSLGLCRP